MNVWCSFKFPEHAVAYKPNLRSTVLRAKGANKKEIE